MAPNRGKGKARAIDKPASASNRARQTTRATRSNGASASAVYDDMLAEATAAETTDGGSDRPLKRRRVGPKSGKAVAGNSSVAPSTTAPSARIIDALSTSDDDDDSDLAFEDVDLKQQQEADDGGEIEDDQGIIDVSVSVDPTPKRAVRTPRKPATAVEKAYRLLVHKFHILCRLAHCIYVNTWCNDATAQKLLRPVLSKKVIHFLNPNPADSQFRQNESFIDGLQQACEQFRGRFEVTASGTRRARWDDAADTAESEPFDRSDFISAAKNLEGSQDVGNQLFCALLRAVGVEARLVCSLQPLPFATSGTGDTPQKTTKPTIYASPAGVKLSDGDTSHTDSAVKSSSTIGKVPSARRRLGQPNFVSDATPSPKPRAKRSVRKLAYPIFWVEAFNPAYQKWVVVDPIVTGTVGKPSKLEPPSSYPLNQLSYVIVFESECVAKDVTRRYARAFNAKTRRSRVESTENGGAWFKRTMRFFRRRGGALDRDQVEDAELAQREARERLPANVLDFKDHPYYALERHLKRHEVIHPKREVGRVNAGTAAKPRMEAVYRRQDVLSCKSADKWFRVGRAVKAGEQPVKRVPARRPRRPATPESDDEAAGEALTPLYAPFQTEQYTPDPVVNGRVPRNAYGNLDVYVPSMVPAGGAHIRHPLAREAAKTLRIDCVEAVTGFHFKGRKGTAVTDGVIVASEYADAVRAVIESLVDDKVEDESRARSAVALRMWKRFLTALRIRERVEQYGESGQGEDAVMQAEDVDGVGEEGGGGGGGFLQSDAADGEALPTAGRFSLVELSTKTKATTRSRKRAESTEESDEHQDPDEEDEDDDDMSNQMSSRVLRSRRKIVEDEEDEEEEDEPSHDHAGEPELVGQDIGDQGGGGFLEDDAMDDGGAGGFDVGDGELGGGFMDAEELGVGFMDDEELGGGFVVDEELGDGVNTGNTTDTEQVTARHAAEEDLTHDIGGVFLSKDATAMSMNASPHSAAGLAGTATSADPPDLATMSNNFTFNAHDHSETAKDTAMEVSTISLACTEHDMIRDSAGEASAGPLSNTHTAEDNGSDNGSMLSHDPEDEDAEPDWLESD